MSNTNWSRKEQCTTDDMSTVSAVVPVILLFLTRSSTVFLKKGCRSNTSGFSQTSYHLTWGFPHVFRRLFYPFSEQHLGKTPSPLTTISLILGGKILFMKYFKKYENRLYTHINTTKKTLMSYF